MWALMSPGAYPKGQHHGASPFFFSMKDELRLTSVPSGPPDLPSGQAAEAAGARAGEGRRLRIETLEANLERWTKSISHQLETMGNHCLLVFAGESSFRGFVGGAKWPWVKTKERVRSYPERALIGVAFVPLVGTRVILIGVLFGGFGRKINGDSWFTWWF